MSSASDFDDIKEIMIKNKDIFESLINILLVWTGARKASLIETANFDGNQEKLRTISDFINNLKLRDKTRPLWVKYDSLSIEEFPRYFVSNKQIVNTPKKHNEIGQLLGFYCAGHDFGNFYEDRLSIEIIANVGRGINVEEYQIYVELCEIKRVDIKKIKKFLQDKINNYNLSMQQLGFDITFKENITVMLGLKTLIRKVKERDINFIIEHQKEYNNYFNNFGYNVIHKFILTNFNTREKLENNFNLYYYLILFTEPTKDYSLLDRFMEHSDDVEYVIEFLQKLDPAKINENNFAEAIEEILY